ncbi:MAG: (2Fe-2S)-binding protein [Bacillota bacterium]
MDAENTVICRCEDLTEAEVLEVIESGYTTIDEIKRVIRLGMGPCRGGTCLQLISRILANYKNGRIDEIKQPTNRPPVEGIKISDLAGELNEK